MMRIDQLADWKSRAHNKVRWSTTAAIVLLFGLASAVYGQSSDKKMEGRIIGRLFDAQTGEALLGGSVRIDSTTMGQMTDLDGNFEIRRVPAGTYAVVASMVGYGTLRVTDVVVVADAPVRLDLALKPIVIETKEIVVEAKRLRNSEVSLLKDRQRATNVSDAISAEMISRSGSGDALQALQRVTGATTQDGKYVAVRGLLGRYTNTLINGALAPTADVNQEAVNMDLIPAGLLENIVVEKSFTPDKAGNFSGGSVNLTTRDFPESRTLTFSTSASYNSETTFKEGVLSDARGGTDWLGHDNGDRMVPDYLLDPNYVMKLRSEGLRDTAVAQQIETDSRSVIGTTMTPRRRTAPLNQSYSLSYGDVWRVFDKPLGLIGSLTYSRSSAWYDNGAQNEWFLRTADDTELSSTFFAREAKGKDETLWGGLLKGSYQVHPNHKLGFVYTRNQNGESIAIERIGTSVNYSSGEYFRTNSLLYTERSLRSYQFTGEHAGLPLGSRFEWMISDATAQQDDLNHRHFGAIADTTTIPDTTLWSLHNTLPTRFFRFLDERNREVRADLQVPFKNWNGLGAKVKVGGSYLAKGRDYREKRFRQEYNPPTITFDGNPDNYYQPENVGIDSIAYRSDGTVSRVFYNITWENQTDPKANFDADLDVIGSYAMVELPVFHWLQLVTGYRYETTDLSLNVVTDTTDDNSTKLIDADHWLPSINLTAKIGENMNLRGAYSQTLARPHFKEIQPVAVFQYIGGGYVNGNQNLTYTRINNHDLRWEYFPRPGELLAVSAFYKKLIDPIEQYYAHTGQANYTYYNGPGTRNWGFEFEVRRRLDRLPLVGELRTLRNVSIGGNLTVMKSEARLPDSLLAARRALDPSASATRQMWGQVPLVFNLDVSFSSPAGTVLTLLVNHVGRKLESVSSTNMPDAFELASTTVDLTASQRIWRGVTAKAAVKNLTDDLNRATVDFNGRSYTLHEHAVGRTISLGMSYSL